MIDLSMKKTEPCCLLNSPCTRRKPSILSRSTRFLGGIAGLVNTQFSEHSETVQSDAAELWTFKLVDGRRVDIRAIHRDDLAHLVAILSGLSAESRYLRYHLPLPALSATETRGKAARIIKSALESGGGLIAFVVTADGSRVPAGVAHYSRTGERGAEWAISVQDNFQRLGLGRNLLRQLSARARCDDIALLYGFVLAENEGMWRLLSQLPYRVTRIDGGASFEARIDLSSNGSGWFTGGHDVSPTFWQDSAWIV
jgi:GNAT superfamily N-acetyltransferase